MNCQWWKQPGDWPGCPVRYKLLFYKGLRCWLTKTERGPISTSGPCV